MRLVDNLILSGLGAPHRIRSDILNRMKHVSN
jgi:hypothetical protein